jgi:hypothetical protein
MRILDRLISLIVLSVLGLGVLGVVLPVIEWPLIGFVATAAVLRIVWFYTR